MKLPRWRRLGTFDFAKRYLRNSGSGEFSEGWCVVAEGGDGGPYVLRTGYSRGRACEIAQQLADVAPYFVRARGWRFRPRPLDEARTLLQAARPPGHPGSPG